MKSRELIRHALGACVAAILSGCGGSPTAGAPAALLSVAAPFGATTETASLRSESALSRSSRTPATEKILYSFKGATRDGSMPWGALTEVNGSIYGTTMSGGNCQYSGGCGTVFVINSSGQEQVVYNFLDSASGLGDTPETGLTAANGTLYGNARLGGDSAPPGDGIVFSINGLGQEQVLYNFQGYPHDGSEPFGANMIALNGMLYGTTDIGGKHGYGTVFAVTTSGSEGVLYSFKGGADGVYPQFLTAINGMLYGTTGIGGGDLQCSVQSVRGCGTIFEVDPATGEETVLYRFKGGVSDGAGPNGLTSIGGALYGTTTYGGSCVSGDCGTIFEFSSAETEQLLYSFKSGSDGASPQSVLTVLNGALYGTTAYGGSKGHGTVFEVSTSGDEQVLYAFKAGKDGAFPTPFLLAVGGTLYGATAYGGGKGCDGSGCGTIFELTP